MKYLLIVSFASFLAIGHAKAATFEFFQDGFEGGGEISGYFIGHDLNGDGLIGYGGPGGFEVESVFLNWSGNPLIGPGFTDSSISGFGVAYVLGSGVIENTESLTNPNDNSAVLLSGGGIQFLGGGWFAGESIYWEIVFGEYDDFLDGILFQNASLHFSDNPVIVTEVVPIPSASILLLAPLLLLNRIRARERGKGVWGL